MTSRVDKSLLCWQSLPAVDVLAAIADHAKQDPTFHPLKSSETTRWHASCGGREFELLLTGAKFWDTRTSVGGGGAIDLAMHLAETGFKGAVKRLKERGL